MPTRPHYRPYLFDARSARWDRTTGWERYTREFATRLARFDDVMVRATGSEGLPSRIWGDVAGTPLAARRARIVHFPTMPPVPWAVSHRQKLVITVHDLTWWRFEETSSRMGRHYYRPLAAAAARRAHVVTGTQAVAEEVHRLLDVPRDRVTVVPLGSALPSPARPVIRARPYILAVGTIEPRKNLGVLAKAYRNSQVARTHDLVIAGRGGWGDAPPGVEIISGLGDQELSDLYGSAAALVLPSLYEGFGLPVVEAMQLGVPVICSDTPVLREVSGGYATFVDPAEPDSIIEALDRVPELEAPSNAAPWARRTWNWDAATARLHELYRELDRN